MATHSQAFILSSFWELTVEGEGLHGPLYYMNNISLQGGESICAHVHSEQEEIVFCFKNAQKSSLEQIIRKTASLFFLLEDPPSLPLSTLVLLENIETGLG